MQKFRIPASELGYCMNVDGAPSRGDWHWNWRCKTLGAPNIRNPNFRPKIHAVQAAPPRYLLPVFAPVQSLFVRDFESNDLGSRFSYAQEIRNTQLNQVKIVRRLQLVGLTKKGRKQQRVALSQRRRAGMRPRLRPRLLLLMQGAWSRGGGAAPQKACRTLEERLTAKGQNTGRLGRKRPQREEEMQSRRPRTRDNQRSIL